MSGMLEDVLLPYALLCSARSMLEIGDPVTPRIRIVENAHAPYCLT